MAKDTYALFSYSVQDELGTKASMFVPVYIDKAAVGTAALETQWTALGGDLDSLTAAQIIDGGIFIKPPLDVTWKSAPAAGSRVEQTANFNFGNAVTRYKFGISVPALKDAAIAGGTVDLTNGAVSAFFGDIVAGFTNGSYVDTGLHILTSLVDAFLAFRKHRKSLTRSSLEPGA